MNRGMIAAISCSILWGLMPLFWHLLVVVPPVPLLAMRVLWSAVLMLLIVGLRGQWQAFMLHAVKPHLILVYFTASLLLGSNWGIFIWSIGHGHLVEVSLGSFIFPLANVMIGIVFFHEKLRPAQWLAVGLACSGVAYITWAYGVPPWIALIQAVNFACYGAIKKKAPLDPTFGLLLETVTLSPVAALYLLAAPHLGLATTPADLKLHGLMMLSGVLTTAPLFLFAVAAQLVSLSVLGISQYIAPTLTLLVAVVAFGEPFTHVQLVGFGLVWVALAVFTVEGLRHSWRRSRGGAIRPQPAEA